MPDRRIGTAWQQNRWDPTKFGRAGICVARAEVLLCAQNSCLKDSNGYGREPLVNKAELIEALSGRLGDRKSATAALDAVLAEIQNAVTKGDKVSITGFGVFEKRVRAARTARNPRTGESVKVKKTSVPAFRPGASFKELVAAGKVPKATKAAAPAKKAPAKAVKATTVKKAAPAKKVARATSAAPKATATARTRTK